MGLEIVKGSRRTVLAAGALVATASVVGAVSGAPRASATARGGPKPTVVLVHGAFADASGWAEVMDDLQNSGYPVLAPANPLRTLSGDAAYLRSVLATIAGPIVLVGHSYGGAVITNAATGNPAVTALVYVAAFVPDEGEPVGLLQGQFPGSQLNETTLDFRPYSLPDGTASVDAYIKVDSFRAVFAADVPRSRSTLMAISQRPADARTLGEPSGAPAWQDIPSWFVVSRDDRAIPAAAQRFMARRAGGDVTEVRTSHAAMIASPHKVSEVIIDAAENAVR